MSSHKISVLMLSIITLLAFSGNTAHAAEVIKEGSQVSLNYVMKVDGEIVDTTENADPLSFQFGTDPLLPGIYEAIGGLAVGDKKSLTLNPEEAFGEHNPQGVVEVPKQNFGEHEIIEGAVFTATAPDGNPIKATILEVKDETVIVDFNHPLAGQTLDVELEIVSIS